jgi:NAD-dependent SIR2 family protein deacetylase
VPADKIIEAHGSFATSKCTRCKRTYDNAMMKEKVLKKEIPRCSRCGGLAKPDIVFFGEGVRNNSSVFRSEHVVKSNNDQFSYRIHFSNLYHPFEKQIF